MLAIGLKPFPIANLHLRIETKTFGADQIRLERQRFVVRVERFIETAQIAE